MEWTTSSVIIEAFAIGNGWIDKYNDEEIDISLLTEVGELSRLLYWNSKEEECIHVPAMTEKITRELADVEYIASICAA